MDKTQAGFMCEQNKSNCDDWHKYGQGRITASIFHEAVSKVSETFEITNPGKVKTILSKFLVRKTILSQKLQNGEKQMSQLLTKNISNLMPKTTKNVVL